MSTDRVISLVRLYRSQYGTTPPAQWLIDKTGMTAHEIREALAKTNPVTPAPSVVYRPPDKPPQTLKQVEAPKIPKVAPQERKSDKAPLPPVAAKKHGFLSWVQRFPSMEQMVLSFADGLQYFGFMVAGIVDVGLSVFFYASLAADLTSQIVMGGLGLVQTTSKIWGWSYSKVLKKAGVVAVAASLMSVFGVTSILRAEFELQAKVVTTSNQKATAQVTQQSDVEILQGQITRQQATVTKAEAARDKFDPAIEEQLPMYRTNKKLADEANDKLNGYRVALTRAQDREATIKSAAPIAPSRAQPVDTTIHLDAWSIFRQWTELDTADHPRVLAYWVTLFFACLLELIIYATTPKKLTLEVGK